MGGCNSSSSIAVDEAHKPASPSLKIAVEKSPTKLDASQGGEVAKVKEKTLEDVLHDNICIEYYAKFLAMEHSSENLDFYESVNYYHHEFDTHKHTAQVKIAPKIFSLYIKLDAPLSVNLPSKIRGKISPFFSDVKKRQNIQKDIFDEASKEIYTVMNRDSFARFRISDLWKEYMEHPDRHPDHVPKPAALRLASSVTGRRNSASLMKFVGTESLNSVLGNAAGRAAYTKFLEIEGGHEHLDLTLCILKWNEFVETNLLGEISKNAYLNILDSAKEIETKLKDCDCLVHSVSQKMENLNQIIQENSTSKNDPEGIPKALHNIMGSFVPLLDALKEHLREENFHIFCNSALYIKYRMTAAKTLAVGTSAYGLTTEQEENPFVNPNRTRANSDQATTNGDGERVKRNASDDSGKLSPHAEEGGQGT